jgi:LacI family transcriptional regulator
MAASIGDVALAAGVSRATASRALTGHPAVLPETRQRVLHAAEALHYRVDPVARALRAGSSNLLGLVVSNLQNPSIQQIVEVIQTRGQTEGYEVVIATTNDDGARERRLIQALAGRRVDGLISMSSGANTELLNKLHEGGLPVVELIRLPNGTKTPSVVYDDRTAGRIATEHLISLGHRDIAFLGGPPSTRSGAERYLGFEEALSSAGVPVNPGFVLRGAFSFAYGVTAMDTLLRSQRRPTALVIANHEATFSALQELNRQNVAIPDDLSVVAIEDDPLLPWWHPAISAIDVQPSVMAAQTLDMLLALVRDSATSPDSVVFSDISLVERSSTAPRRAE